jgi:hypothetical protein
MTVSPRHMSGEYILVSNGKSPVSNVKKRAKMFAVCAWMQIAVFNHDLINVLSTFQLI